MSKSKVKVRTSVQLDQEIIDWLDKKVKSARKTLEGREMSRSQQIRNELYASMQAEKSRVDKSKGGK